MDIQQALQKVLNNKNLTIDEMCSVMRLIMSGKTTEAQLGGFLIGLRCKGETIDEIVAAVEVMRELATKVVINGQHVIDTCGTGGDGANTFNISTTCAFVVAAAGGQVAKHGNRSVSSSCGSADLLEAAGVKNVTTYHDKEKSPGIGIHEMGTARMGNDPKTSILNKWNQMHQVSNVFVTDGACMTSAACVNPSLTYMALTARAVDYAVKQMKNNNL